MTSFPLRAEARVALPDAARHVEPICAHLEGHGARRRRLGNAQEIAFPFSRALLEPRGDVLAVIAEAADDLLLYEIEQEIEEHLEEFAHGRAGPAVWEGDPAPRPQRPPNFRLATVVAARHVTPRMRRVTLKAERALRFTSPNDLHVKLLIPPRDGLATWPTFGSDGGFVWPTGAGSPEVRKYTVRSFDRGEGTIDVDFALHDDPGPGARWGAEALPGDVVGVVGPGGRSVPERDWLFLAGDETALPAISRILEAAPRATRGVALIEIAQDDERQDIAAPEGFEIRWLVRGRGSSLAEAAKAVEPPPAGASRFFWAATEHADFKALLAHAKRSGWAKDERLIVSYWRKGRRGHEDGLLTAALEKLLG